MLVLSLVLALFGQPADASPATVYVQLSGWIVYSNDRDCHMRSTMKRDTDDAVGALTLRYDDRAKQATLGFVDPDARGFRKYDRRELSIVLLRGKAKVDESWGRRGFVVGRTSDGADVATFSVALDEEVLIDLAHNSRIEFRDGETLVHRYSLSGAGEAIHAMERCARARVPRRERSY